MRRKRIGAILVERGLISEDQLNEALAIQSASSGLLGQILVRRGLLAEEDLINALSIQFDLNLLDELFDQALSVTDPAARDGFRHKIQRLSLLLKSLAAISAVQMMLDQLGESAAAQRIERAIIAALASGKILSLNAGRMGLTCSEVGDLVASLV